MGRGWLAYLRRAGLGSKVSTWDGPPLRKKWMTRLAFGKNGGLRAARGVALEIVWEARARFSQERSWRRVESVRAPMPMPQRWRSWRREKYFEESGSIFSGLFLRFEPFDLSCQLI